MASAPSVAIEIVGDDKPALKAFDRVERRMGQFVRAGSGLASQAGAGFRTLGRSVGAATEGLGRFSPALLALTGAASVAGMAKLVDSWGAFGQRLGLDAQRMGVATDQLQALQGAARLSGVSAQAATQGYQSLRDSLVDAIGGRAPQIIQMLGQLGIAFQDANGNARDAGVVMGEVADRIARVKDPTLQARILAPFGAEDLLPLLRRGSAGFAEYLEQARRYGAINQEGVRQATALREAQTRLNLAFEGLGYAVAERVAPTLVPMLLRLSDWVAAHRDDIASFFERVTQAIRNLAEAPALQGVVSVLGRFASVAASIAGSLPVEVISVFLGLWVGAKVIGAIRNIHRMTAALGGFKAASQAAGVAGATSVAAGGGVGSFLRALAVRGLLADMLVTGLDPEDRVGAWIDRNIPGASFVDNLFSHLGFGRSYAEQDRVDAALGARARPGGGVRPAESKTFDTSLTPQARGLLDTIAGTESPGYDVMYGGRRFSDFSQHPNTPVPITSGPNAGQTSTAAGRYQFLKSTWDEAKAALNLPDFSPASQDRAAWWLAQRDYNKRSGRDLPADLNSVDPAVRSSIGQILSGTWTSLPSGIESATDRARFMTQLDANTERERAAPAIAPAPAPAAPAGAPGANGQVTVRLENVSPPQGQRTTVATSGDVRYGGLRIERPSLGAVP